MYTVVGIGRVLNVNIIERRVTRFLKIYILSIFRGICRYLDLFRVQSFGLFVCIWDLLNIK